MRAGVRPRPRIGVAADLPTGVDYSSFDDRAVESIIGRLGGISRSCNFFISTQICFPTR